jgi:hypothetical protein
MGGWPSRVKSLGKDAKCRCHGAPVASLEGPHAVEGADGSLLKGEWALKVTRVPLLCLQCQSMAADFARA